MVEVRLDDRLLVMYYQGRERAIEVVVSLDGEEIVSYETNSRPWDEGIVQVRNVAAMNLDDEYSRGELHRLLSEAVPDHEPALNDLFA